MYPNVKMSGKQHQQRKNMCEINSLFRFYDLVPYQIVICKLDRSHVIFLIRRSVNFQFRRSVRRGNHRSCRMQLSGMFMGMFVAD